VRVTKAYNPAGWSFVPEPAAEYRVMPFENFEHTADLGLRVWAADLDALFAEAGRGLFAMIVPDLASVRPAESVDVKLGGEPSELLLFDWLNELLYLYEVKHLLLARFDVRVGDDGLTGTAEGEPIDPARHVLDHEVKAITYHGLKLERQADRWLAEVIVDI
jgi:SHS2 domain-containing protein